MLHRGEIVGVEQRHRAADGLFGATVGIAIERRQQGWRVERRIFLSRNREMKLMPNLMAEVAVFLVSGGPR